MKGKGLQAVPEVFQVTHTTGGDPGFNMLQGVPTGNISPGTVMPSVASLSKEQLSPEYKMLQYTIPLFITSDFLKDVRAQYFSRNRLIRNKTCSIYVWVLWQKKRARINQLVGLLYKHMTS